MEILQKITLAFTIIGAINWGLIGLLNFNLVETIFNNMPIIQSIIYSIVGICGIINIGIFFVHFRKMDM